MIIGLGSDLCNIDRIQNSLDRFGERFLARVFTEAERARADKRPFTRAGTLAKRFRYATPTAATTPADRQGSAGTQP